MIRGTIAALAIAGFVAIGCDSKDEPKASSTEVKDAAEKTGAEAANAMDKMQDATKDATNAMKDNAGKMESAAKETAAKAETSMKDGAAALQTTVDGLIEKAKTAVKEAKFSDAEGYIKQIEEKKSMLPADYQGKVDAALAEVKKLIESGKNLMPAK